MERRLGFDGIEKKEKLKKKRGDYTLG